MMRPPFRMPINPEGGGGGGSRMPPFWQGQPTYPTGAIAASMSSSPMGVMARGHGLPPLMGISGQTPNDPMGGGMTDRGPRERVQQGGVPQYNQLGYSPSDWRGWAATERPDLLELWLNAQDPTERATIEGLIQSAMAYSNRGGGSDVGSSSQSRGSEGEGMLDRMLRKRRERGMGPMNSAAGGSRW